MLANKVFISAIWMVGARWAARLMGFISTVILARILYPEEYGIVAVASLIVHSLQIFTAVGADAYLIRKKNLDESDFHTAWTINVLLFLAIGFCLLVSAQVMTEFFNEPRLEPVLILLSFTTCFSGLTSIKVAQLRKDLTYHKVFWLETLTKTCGFITTVALAFALRSYWAMVYGIIVFHLSGVVLSYVFAPYHPRLSLSRFHEQWVFSKWFVLRNFTGLLRAKSDQVIVSSSFGTTTMGQYSMANHISSLPATEVLYAINGILYSAFAKCLDDPQRLSAAYLKSTGILLSLMIPTAFGMAILSEELVLVLLGDHWASIHYLLAILAMITAIQAVQSPAGALMTALGKVKQLAIIDWMVIFILVPALLVAGVYGDVHDLALTRAAVGILPMIFILALSVQSLPIPVRLLFFTIFRPFAATAIMAIALYAFAYFVPLPINAASLIVKILLGVATYTLSIIVIWRLSGSPDSGEKFFIDKTVVLWRKIRVSTGIH